MEATTLFQTPFLNTHEAVHGLLQYVAATSTAAPFNSNNALSHSLPSRTIVLPALAQYFSSLGIQKNVLRFSHKHYPSSGDLSRFTFDPERCTLDDALYFNVDESKGWSVYCMSGFGGHGEETLYARFFPVITDFKEPATKICGSRLTYLTRRAFKAFEVNRQFVGRIAYRHAYDRLDELSLPTKARQFTEDTSTEHIHTDWLLNLTNVVEKRLSYPPEYEGALVKELMSIRWAAAVRPARGSSPLVVQVGIPRDDASGRAYLWWLKSDWVNYMADGASVAHADEAEDSHPQEALSEELVGSFDVEV